MSRPRAARVIPLRAAAPPWAQCVRHYVEALPKGNAHERAASKWLATIAQSEAMAKALDGLPGSDAAVLARMRAIIDCLLSIEYAVRHAADPRTLADLHAKQQQERRELLGHLYAAEQLLQAERRGPGYTWRYAAEHVQRIGELIAAVQSEPLMLTSAEAVSAHFEPRNLKRKGKAGDGGSAFKGWMVRELARHIPKEAPKRAAAISALLALVDIDVEPTTAATLLRRFRG